MNLVEYLEERAAYLQKNLTMPNVKIRIGWFAYQDAYIDVSWEKFPTEVAKNVYRNWHAFEWTEDKPKLYKGHGKRGLLAKNVFKKYITDATMDFVYYQNSDVPYTAESVLVDVLCNIGQQLQDFVTEHGKDQVQAWRAEKQLSMFTLYG